MARGDILFRSVVRAIRRRSGISQKELGALCSPRIPAGRISDIETGRKEPTLAEARSLREAIRSLPPADG